MEIGREGVHHHDLSGQRSHEAGHFFLEKMMVRFPGSFALEMALYSIPAPSREFLGEVRLRGFGLQAEGISAKIDRLPALVDGETKAVAKAGEGIQLVLGVHIFRKKVDNGFEAQISPNFTLCGVFLPNGIHFAKPTEKRP
jgi:hypothetical protein